jgi:hypothetical protein
LLHFIFQINYHLFYSNKVYSIDWFKEAQEKYDRRFITKIINYFMRNNA